MLEIEKIEKAWATLSPYLFVPRSEVEFDKLVEILDELLDKVSLNENHPLASLIDIIGSLIEQYENENVPEPGHQLPPNYEKK